MSDQLLCAVSARLQRTKLPLATWNRAASLIAASERRVRLRDLRVVCGVSHKTAWRMRELLTDAAELIREQRLGDNARNQTVKLKQ